MKEAAMPAGPIEGKFSRLWRERLEGSPGMLQSTYEERTRLTADETVELFIRMIGATRDAFLLVTREIDKLNAARG
jgi:hypothetical protein